MKYAEPRQWPHYLSQPERGVTVRLDEDKQPHTKKREAVKEIDDDDIVCEELSYRFHNAQSTFCFTVLVSSGFNTGQEPDVVEDCQARISLTSRKPSDSDASWYKSKPRSSSKNDRFYRKSDRPVFVVINITKVIMVLLDDLNMVIVVTVDSLHLQHGDGPWQREKAGLVRINVTELKQWHFPERSGSSHV